MTPWSVAVFLEPAQLVEFQLDRGLSLLFFPNLCAIPALLYLPFHPTHLEFGLCQRAGPVVITQGHNLYDDFVAIRIQATGGAELVEGELS